MPVFEAGRQGPQLRSTINAPQRRADLVQENRAEVGQERALATRLESSHPVQRPEESHLHDIFGVD